MVTATTKAKSTKKKTAKRATSASKKAEPLVIHVPTACRSCSTLPVGSVELTSLLLVLIFSLVSVLFTSILALKAQDQKIANLQAQVASTEIVVSPIE